MQEKALGSLDDKISEQIKELQMLKEKLDRVYNNSIFYIIDKYFKKNKKKV